MGKTLGQKQRQVDGPKLSYWSIDESKTGGVAILLNPSVANEATSWMKEQWSKKVIAINLEDRHIVNVYAPNTQQTERVSLRGYKTGHGIKQQRFWREVSNVCFAQRWTGREALGQVRSESQALPDLMLQLEIEDSNILAGHAEEEDEAFEPTEYYTYWGPEAAIRIDRVYVPGHSTDKVQWVVVDEPPAPSDHQRVRLYLGGGQSGKQQRNQQRGMIYPLWSAHPEETKHELLGDQRVVGIGQNVTSQTWDGFARQCRDCVRALTKRERRC